MNVAAIPVWMVGLVEMIMGPTDTTVTVHQAGSEEDVEPVNITHHSPLAHLEPIWREHYL